MARLRPGWRIAVVITFALASCGAPAAVSSPPPSCALDCAPGAGAPHAQVFVEPDAGAAPVLAAIAGATGSLELEIYLLSDTSVIQALEEAANRGVDVRVLLEYAPFGDAGTAAQITAAKLTAAGVHVKRSNPTFRYTHEKALVVDQATTSFESMSRPNSRIRSSAERL
jgi:cardiolipin synthase